MAPMAATSSCRSGNSSCPTTRPCWLEDLFTGASWLWRGKIQHLLLDPASNPAAIWRLSRITHEP